jgi:phage terminase small subunit
MSVHLSKKHEIFVAEFLVDHNASRAAIAAGYSKNGAGVTGHRLLKSAKIATRIAEKTAKTLQKLEITAERVLNELAKLAFLDPRKLFNPDGSLKPVTDLDDDTAAAIAGMDIEKLYEHFSKGGAKNVGTVTKVKLLDKGINLERLGRHLKLFTDKIEIADADQLVKKLQAGRARARG